MRCAVCGSPLRATFENTSMNRAVNTGLVSLASVACQLSGLVCVCCTQKEMCTVAGGTRTLSSANRTESASLEIFVFLLGDVLGGVTTCS